MSGWVPWWMMGGRVGACRMHHLPLSTADDPAPSTFRDQQAALNTANRCGIQFTHHSGCYDSTIIAIYQHQKRTWTLHVKQCDPIW